MHKQFLSDNLVKACQKKSQQPEQKRKVNRRVYGCKGVIFRFIIIIICMYVFSFISMESDMADAWLLRATHVTDAKLAFHIGFPSGS